MQSPTEDHPVKSAVMDGVTQCSVMTTSDYDHTEVDVFTEGLVPKAESDSFNVLLSPEQSYVEQSPAMESVSHEFPVPAAVANHINGENDLAGLRSNNAIGISSESNGRDVNGTEIDSCISRENYQSVDTEKFTENHCPDEAIENNLSREGSDENGLCVVNEPQEHSTINQQFINVPSDNIPNTESALVALTSAEDNEENKSNEKVEDKIVIAEKEAALEVVHDSMNCLIENSNIGEGSQESPSVKEMKQLPGKDKECEINENKVLATGVPLEEFIPNDGESAELVDLGEASQNKIDIANNCGKEPDIVNENNIIGEENSDGNSVVSELAGNVNVDLNPAIPECINKNNNLNNLIEDDAESMKSAGNNSNVELDETQNGPSTESPLELNKDDEKSERQNDSIFNPVMESNNLGIEKASQELLVDVSSLVANSDNINEAVNNENKDDSASKTELLVDKCDDSGAKTESTDEIIENVKSQNCPAEDATSSFQAPSTDAEVRLISMQHETILVTNSLDSEAHATINVPEINDEELAAVSTRSANNMEHILEREADTDVSISAINHETEVEGHEAVNLLKAGGVEPTIIATLEASDKTSSYAISPEAKEEKIPCTNEEKTLGTNDEKTFETNEEKNLSEANIGENNTVVNTEVNAENYIFDNNSEANIEINSHACKPETGSVEDEVKLLEANVSESSIAGNVYENCIDTFKNPNVTKDIGNNAANVITNVVVDFDSNGGKQLSISDELKTVEQSVNCSNSVVMNSASVFEERVANDLVSDSMDNSASKSISVVTELPIEDKRVAENSEFHSPRDASNCKVSAEENASVINCVLSH